MDTGKGQFLKGDLISELEEKFSNYPKHGGIFTIGEKLEIRGSKFIVRKITKKDIFLRLVKR